MWSLFVGDNVEIEVLDEEEKKGIIDAAKDYYRGIKGDLVAFLETDFFDSYEDLVDVYCSGKTKEYLEKRENEIKNKTRGLEKESLWSV